MNRTATLAMLAFTALAAGGLFAIAYEVNALEEDLIALNGEIVADREAVHVLKAEWAYLNQPARLKQLSHRFLSLAPTVREQFAALDAVPARLPAAGAVAAVIDGVLTAPVRRRPPPRRAYDDAVTGSALTPTTPAALMRSLDDVLADLLLPVGAAAGR